MLTVKFEHFCKVAKFLNLTISNKKIKIVKFKNSACVNPKSTNLFSTLLFIYGAVGKH